MTAGNVSSASDAAMTVMNVKAGRSRVSDAGQGDTSFMSFLTATAGMQSEGNIPELGKNSVKADTLSKETAVEKSDAAVRDASDTVSETDASKNVSADNTDKTEKVEEAYHDIAEAVKEELGLTDEELNALLAQLGFTISDLLIPQNAAVLVAAANGTDVTVIVTDEAMAKELNSLVARITQIVQETAEKTDVTVREFSEMLADFESNLPEHTDNEDTVHNQIPDMEDKDAATVPVKDEYSGREIKVSVENNQTQELLQEHTEASGRQTGGQAAGDGFGNNRNEGNGSRSFAENILYNINQAVGETAAFSSETAGNYTVNSADIINQMLEAVRINVTPDTTSMEIQLTPENLGRINLNVASKNGVITATITTQNESVRAVIENQLIQLKESLNNQGLKVQDVEVTIASQGFSMNQDKASEDTGRENGQKTRRSFRTDNELPANDMIISEIAERQLMEANGNSVSYTA